MSNLEQRLEEQPVAQKTTTVFLPPNQPDIITQEIIKQILKVCSQNIETLLRNPIIFTGIMLGNKTDFTMTTNGTLIREKDKFMVITAYHNGITITDGAFNYTTDGQVLALLKNVSLFKEKENDNINFHQQYKFDDLPFTTDTKGKTFTISAEYDSKGTLIRLKIQGSDLWKEPIVTESISKPINIDMSTICAAANINMRFDLKGNQLVPILGYNDKKQHLHPLPMNIQKTEDIIPVLQEMTEEISMLKGRQIPIF